MKLFAHLLMVPVVFCLTFPSASSLTNTLGMCASNRRACVKTISITNGPDVGTYDLFFAQTYATFNLQDYINAFAPDAAVCQ